MARFIKLTESKSKPKTSIRRKTLKWAAAMIASMVAMPALGLNANAWNEVHSTMDDQTEYFDVDFILLFIYVLSLDGEDWIVHQVTGRRLRVGQHCCVQLPWRCRNSFVISNQPLQLGTRINPEDDVVVLRSSGVPGRKIARAQGPTIWPYDYEREPRYLGAGWATGRGELLTHRDEGPQFLTTYHDAEPRFLTDAWATEQAGLLTHRAEDHQFLAPYRDPNEQWLRTNVWMDPMDQNDWPGDAQLQARRRPHRAIDQGRARWDPESPELKRLPAEYERQR
jgi:hypothetical protein